MSYTPDRQRVNVAQRAGGQCRLVQRGRQVLAGEFVIIVIPLVLHGE
jgi:hypothetical protein